MRVWPKGCVQRKRDELPSERERDGERDRNEPPQERDRDKLP